MTGEGWLRSADRALALAASHVKLIRAVTPTNVDSELADLERSFRRGAPRAPRFVYDAAEVPPGLCLALEKLALFLEERSPLGAVYAARARELCVEAAIVEAVGTPRLRLRAEERFLQGRTADISGGSTDEAREDLVRADQLAATWAAVDPEGGIEAVGDQRVRTNDEADESSLISRMASEVGRHRLAIRVVPQAGLASLAATGDGVILVAPDKWILRRDVERTVLHEIAGHALPRAQAALQPIGIFALGTAHGIDDQEGRALLIEESAGFLDAGRRRELGLRHIAARKTLEGQPFVDVTRDLLGRGAALEDALRIAVRVGRGGYPSGGLAREVVYLPAFLRVGRAMCGPFATVVERMMSSGRIAADVAPSVAIGVASAPDLAMKDAAHVLRD